MARRLQKCLRDRYVVATLSVMASAVLTLAIQPFFNGKAPLFFFTIAVILSASYGGLVTGLLATALSGFTVRWLFGEPVLMMAQYGLTVFTLVGVVASVFIERLHRMNVRLAQSNVEVEASKQKISEQADTLRRLNAKLSKQTQGLLKANDELQRFAYALAHDLNTPLRGIHTLTELLLHRNAGKLDDRSRECAALIVDKARGMESMIQGLLDYASAVDKPDERAATDANRIVVRAVQDLDSAIAATHARITWDALPCVYATEALLVRVFTNLIGNAVKYCPKDRNPEVHISATQQNGDGVFCVRDNGIGLDMKYADDIFGMFSRLHPAGEFEGSGIGLALCRMVIHRHGGRIWVESEPGSGCRFFFTLPCTVEGRPETSHIRSGTEGSTPPAVRATEA
jgi:light-regulated signal transduction histidine kinase (bacteriophytochrome)